jgi:Protein of unknown function, DUF547
VSPKPIALGLVLLTACTTRVRSPSEAPKDDPSSEWANLLDRAATPEGVDYDLIDSEREKLDAYIAWIGEHGPHTDEIRESYEDRRLSFLINAYNGAVIYGVLAHRPMESVRDVKLGVWRAAGSGFFYGLRFRVDGEWLALHNLEQQYIVARFQEPLVHAALNCASKGCPPARWYESTNLQRQLRASMRDFINSDVGMVQTPTGWAGSELFSWYADDFLDWSEAPTVCAWMEAYAEGERRGWLTANRDNCPLEVIPYDWSLNFATAPPGRVLPSRQTDKVRGTRRLVRETAGTAPIGSLDKEAAGLQGDSGT